MKAPRKRMVRLLILAAGLLILLAACSSSGAPLSYDDQVDEETGLSNVQQNFIEGCEVSFDEELAADANRVCGCSYARIRNEVPFEAFVEMDSRIADDASRLPATNDIPDSTERQVVEIIKDCISSG